MGCSEAKAVKSKKQKLRILSVPVKLLHEAEGHIVSLQTQTGEMFRGKLLEAEDNMNCLLRDTTVTYTNGRAVQMENVYVRGSKIVMLILPDMFKNAPMFRKQGRGGRGTRGGFGGFGGSRGGRGGMQRGRGGGGYGGYHGGGYQEQRSSYYLGYPLGLHRPAGTSGGTWR